MKLSVLFYFALVYVVTVSQPALAHFGMVIPSKNIVEQDDKSLHLTLSFSHPFEGVGMELSKPKRFFSVCDNTTNDLTGSLHSVSVMKHQGWQVEQTVGRPCVYHYVMEPQPYWEPSEDIHIIHYTKTILSAFGATEGWDTPLGLPTEIVPLLRPFGNYAGNSFTGRVMIDAKPASLAEVEVEMYNPAKKYSSTSGHHITQVVKTDENGIFHFTCDQPGWWGFSALSEASFKLKDPQGQDKPVEQGGVLWVYFDQRPE